MALELDPRKTALVMIDLQKGILSTPRLPHDVETVVDRNVTLAKAVKAAGGRVVAVRVDFGAGGELAPKGATDTTPMGDLPADFADLRPEILALAPDLIVTKRQWGAFFGTDLDPCLRRLGVETVLVAGVATNMGVESTVREGWSLGYGMVVVEDACSSFAAEAHDFATTKILPRIARVRSTAQTLNGLGAA
ncbi:MULTISPECIES: isochorismatase family protein [unclassified Brevundimonas]|uniref:isochorismatase family protein n=1 Tax=unclassified Brevundimonas TaxID=2622653 RepID=UPI002003D714|nr:MULTISPECIES: isochorismatase family protein [unclassified Brevundimonas]MCK6104085.1 isochorismatase family protein [Brevundimonas sp. EYE_349]